MEFKGTKGEWSWEENSASQVDDSTCIEVRSSGGPQIAYLQSFVGWGADYERNSTIANANLIAAAPDLLEALQEIVFLYEHDEGCRELTEYKRAKEAISKALGEE